MTELRTTFKTALLLTALGILSVAVTGCFENNASSTKFATNITSLNGVNTTNTGTVLAISNVGIVASSTASSGYLTTVYFNPSTSSANISTYCSSQSSSTSTTGNVCVCNYAWAENNTTSGTTVAIQRGVQTTVQNVQNSLVTCNAPPTFSSILNGTVIQVSVLPGTGNATSFPMTAFSYTKTNTTGTSDFQDAQGDSFQDVLRYTCYEQYQRGMSVASQLLQITNPNDNGGTAVAPLANSFCVQTRGGNPSSTTCAGQNPAMDFSSQSYYYNLYIRDSEQGDINLSNGSYFCPSVKESLNNNGSVGTQNTPWPLDRTFALSLGATTTFNVGVQAFTELSDGSSDPTTQGGGSCGTSVSATASPTPTSSGTSSGGTSLVSGCLGFAAAPNPDSTCPSFRDSNNQVHFTYRLRRYFTVYPVIYDADGTPLPQAQSSDTIYVLDRPVTSPNPLQPYTMAGPKPCPWAYYDRAGVNGASASLGPFYTETNSSVPGYWATNNAAWNGKNVDGAQFPYTDSSNSCSAVIPIINSSKTAMSLGTISASNPVFTSLYIRGVSPWAPHYVEDTSFKACAPQSSKIQDPPLHFSKDSLGNVGWCAEVYPTQNPNVSTIDPYNGGLAALGYPAADTYAGFVLPFTSHVVKNAASPACTYSALGLPTGYPASSTGACGVGGTTGLAGHPSNLVVDSSAGAAGCSQSTCDRTVSTVTGQWTKFPMLAPEADVESAITNDIANYGCLVTYDNGGTKTGKVSPSGGCCAAPSVFVKTGLTGASAAHLEPTVTCATPSY